MFRIRRIYDNILPIDRAAIAEVQDILRRQFSALPEEDIENIPRLLRNPLESGYRTMLYVAEKAHAPIRGFALLCHFPSVRFCFLDFISVPPKQGGRGIGSVLYDRVREESRLQNVEGLFFECLPDDPALCRDQEILPQNRARLRFYERHGARPIEGTKYETLVTPGGDCPPYLVFDPLGGEPVLNRDLARRIVREILELKYAGTCPPKYVNMVVRSFTDDPVRIRDPRYKKTPEYAVPRHIPTSDRQIALVITDRHEIHHVRERGYVESPVRINSITDQLRKLPLFHEVPPKRHGRRHITAVHDKQLVAYMERVSTGIGKSRSVYPYVFPVRNAARPPRELEVRAGYYCIDTFTPLNESAWLAALRAVDCGLTAADEILAGRRIAYALVRPPGHHAETKVFGGFCYLNTSGIAAHYLSQYGRVAVLDIDYHHGNGTQEMFYARDDILTVSIHGHPRFAYPYFSGFDDEQGDGAGQGFCFNIPLGEHVDGPAYLVALKRALAAVKSYSPQFLIVGLGLDTAKGDPTGTWSLSGGDFHANGALIGGLGLPTLVVQEGGYRIRSLGMNARKFFEGLWDGAFPEKKSVLDIGKKNQIREEK